MIRRYLIAGCITLLPSVVTLWILRAIFDQLVTVFSSPAAWVAHRLHLATPPYWQLALISGIGTLLLLVGVGALVGNFIGKQLLSWVDELVMHVPVVKGIYGATKQLMNAIQSGKSGTFKEVVLVEWPHPGSFTIGFIAHRDCAWTGLPGATVAVYVPTSPNPTSGYVIIVDESKIKPLALTPEEALTWAISGGVVAPNRKSENLP
jgi:uncharacterized membrane protein